LTTATVAAGAVVAALPADAQFAPPTPTGAAFGRTTDPINNGLRPGFPFNPQLPPNGNGFNTDFNNPFANPFTNGQAGFGAFANPFTNQNAFGAQFDPRFSNGVVNPLAGSGFTGVNNFGNFIDPRLAGTFGGNAFVSPFTSVGGPGFGGGSAYYGPGALGPLNVTNGIPPSSYTTARLPLLGINSSARTVGGLPPNLFANRRIGGTASARTVRTQTSTAASRSRDMNADLEVRAATRMAQIMKTRPMVPGHVTRVDTSAIQVKLDDRRNTTRNYGPSEVFFYRNDQLLDAAVAPGKLRKGEAVLVPDSSGQVS